MPIASFAAELERLTPEFWLAAAVCWLPPAAWAERHAALVRERCGRVADWDRFLALVDRHRIPALAHSNLAVAGLAVPGKVLETLRQGSRETKLAGLGLTAELVRLGRRFDQAAIPFLPLKGPLLSFQLYGDPAQRQARDLDLLVPAAELERAQALLALEGYLPEPGYERLSPVQARFVRADQHHFCLHHPGRAIEVELHWNCGDWSDPDMDRLWVASTSTGCFGMTLRTLPWELQLLQLADHGARHQWFRLKWLGDLARLLAGAGSPWAQLLACAEGLDRTRCLGQGALLAEQLCGIPLADPVARVAHTPVATGLARRALEALQAPPAGSRLGLGDVIREALYVRRLRPGAPVGPGLRRFLVRPRDLEWAHLPDGCLWLCPLLRPFSWLWRHHLDRRLRAGRSFWEQRTTSRSSEAE